jgi:hypothetical protein
MTINLQPIDDTDWSAFQGAISWPDGHRPLFATGVFPSNDMPWCLVISPEGATMVAQDERQIEGGYVLDTDGFPTPEDARAWVAEHLPAEPRNRLDFMLAGFE